MTFRPARPEIFLPPSEGSKRDFLKKQALWRDQRSPTIADYVRTERTLLAWRCRHLPHGGSSRQHPGLAAQPRRTNSSLGSCPRHAPALVAPRRYALGTRFLEQRAPLHTFSAARLDDGPQQRPLTCCCFKLLRGRTRSCALELWCRTRVNRTKCERMFATKLSLDWTRRPHKHSPRAHLHRTQCVRCSDPPRALS